MASLSGSASVETFTKNKTHKFNPAPYAVFISNLFGPGMSFVGGQQQIDLKSIILLFMGNNLMSPLHFNLRIICLAPGKFLLETSVRSFLRIILSDGPIIMYTFIGTQAPETKAFNPKRRDSLCIVNKKAKISPETI